MEMVASQIQSHHIKYSQRQNSMEKKIVIRCVPDGASQQRAYFLYILSLFELIPFV